MAQSVKIHLSEKEMFFALQLAYFSLPKAFWSSLFSSDALRLALCAMRFNR